MLIEQFLRILDKHIGWLKQLDNDLQLFDFRNKANLNELTSFLKDPNPHFEGWVRHIYMDEHCDFRRGFLRFLVAEHRPLDKQFAPIVFELEYILESTPSGDYETMHENNRQLYYELNKYILNPQRIEKMATKFGLEFSAYLDAIDV
jgi:hypothetical protein